MEVEIKVKTRFPRDGARFCLDSLYELKRSFPCDRWEDTVVESEVRFVGQLETHKRPQDLSREILAWFTRHYRTRLVFCRVRAGGSRVIEDYEVMRLRDEKETPAERSGVTHYRAKGDPYIEVE